MSHIQTGWKPSRRKVKYPPRPDWVPDEIYKSTVSAKKTYNEGWEYWVWGVAQQYNVSQSEAEMACMRGIQKELYKIRFIYGPRIGTWFEQYLEMGDIFTKINHPEYLPELGYRQGSMSIEVKPEDGTKSAE